MSGPEVSVVVPTVGRLPLLERCLRGLARQDGVTFEAVVVHGGEPGVEVLLDAWADRVPLRPLRCPDRGASERRNAGWRAARAPLVAFTDDDCEPTPGWLAAATAAFAGGADLVQGPVRPHPDDAGVQGPFARTVVVDAPTPLYPNANLVYRRSALERAGGYDPAFRGGEDTDLAWRVREQGGAVAWAPDALVWHAVRSVGFADHLRSLPRWSTLPLVLRRHPQLREQAHRRVFWKDTHPTAALALAGLLAAPLRPRAALLAAPHLARRWRAAGPRRGLALAVADVVEVGVMVAGSLRHGAVLL